MSRFLEDVKHTIVEKITGMTVLEVSGVNLRIEDFRFCTEEEYDRFKHRSRKSLNISQIKKSKVR